MPYMEILTLPVPSCAFPVSYTHLYEVMDKVITQGKELGIYAYLFTGGEPLVRKDDIIRLCEKHKDCLLYTSRCV